MGVILLAFKEKEMKTFFLLFIGLFCLLVVHAQTVVADQKSSNTFGLEDAVILIDAADHQLVQVAATHLQSDIEKVTGRKIPLVYQKPSKATTIIIIGSADKS